MISGWGAFFVKPAGAPHDYNNPRKLVSTENQVTTVIVNGEHRHFPPQTTLLDVVRALHLEPERVAIELNRAIVKREKWSDTMVWNGAEMEIVRFVGGG
jgi:sulfur carrier protein